MDSHLQGQGVEQGNRVAWGHGGGVRDHHGDMTTIVNIHRTWRETARGYVR